jgi:hypothetical protein
MGHGLKKRVGDRSTFVEASIFCITPVWRSSAPSLAKRVASFSFEALLGGLHLL